MNLKEERLALLNATRDQRRRQVMLYQVNIDNYRGAIAEIEKNHGGDKAMKAFAQQLQAMVASETVEQTKEKIMLAVIEQQMGA